MSEADDYDEIDRLALDRAIQLTLAEDDPCRVEQVRSMLATRRWGEVAAFLQLPSAIPQPEHRTLADDAVVDRPRPDRRHHQWGSRSR